MPQSEHFDVLVLGSGAGGKLIAWHMARNWGQRTGVVERRWIGGSCPNNPCMPSKNEIASAKVARTWRVPVGAMARLLVPLPSIWQRLSGEIIANCEA
jgi:pyruvate/2-oxoglutarate dehydrogenase complex dihydrolipoamide dehydrogenase (E3) component